jgi:hypothetical protein
MFIAMALVRDYVEVNLKRTKDDFIAMYASILAIQLAVLFRYPHSEFWLPFIGLFLFRAMIWLVLLICLLYLLFLITAYFTLVPLVRNAGMTMRDYLQSKDYQISGKQKLKRADKERKWF